MSFWLDTWLPYIFRCAGSLQLPDAIEALNPYEDQEVRRVCQLFYEKYYADDHPRKLIFGINPGRLGAGMTGIGFTDPARLADCCHICHSIIGPEELSSKYVYSWIDRYGGVEAFFKEYLLLAVCPIGFVRDGRNLNYYDLPELYESSLPLIIQQQDLLLDFQGRIPIAFLLGKGKNLTFFKRLNEEHHWYQHIIDLPHPRWVMQYQYQTRFEWMDRMTEGLLRHG